MSTASITHCLNCNTDLHGKIFCGNCGQRNVNRRLRWNNLIEDLNVHIFEWDLPWLKTISDLTIRPGKVCSDYVEGRRIVYVHPIKYLFYILAILVILTGFKPHDKFEIAISFFSQLTFFYSKDFIELLPVSLQFILTNIPVYNLLMSPVAIILFRLLFWRSKRNWVEVSCFIFYMIAHCSLLITIVGFLEDLIDPVLNFFLPFGKSSGIILMIFVVFYIPVYIAFASVKFFKSRLDWSFLGSFIGMFSYMISCFAIPGYLFGIYVPVMNTYINFEYTFSLL